MSFASDSLVVRTMSTALSTCIWVDRIMCVSITSDRHLRLMPNSHRRRRRDETHQCEWGINSPAGRRVRRCLGGRTRLVRKLEDLLWICCTTSCRISFARVAQWPAIKASAYGSRVGWTPARRIHTYIHTSCRILWNVADLLNSCSICCRFVVCVDLLYNLSTLSRSCEFVAGSLHRFLYNKSTTNRTTGVRPLSVTLLQ